MWSKTCHIDKTKNFLSIHYFILNKLTSKMTWNIWKKEKISEEKFEIKKRLTRDSEYTVCCILKWIHLFHEVCQTWSETSQFRKRFRQIRKSTKSLSTKYFNSMTFSQHTFELLIDNRIVHSLNYTWMSIISWNEASAIYWLVGFSICLNMMGKATTA